MVLTFVVMLLSGMGQPALLYLVPFTVITSAVVAGCRGEMKQFWAGTTYTVRTWEGEELFMYTFDMAVAFDSVMVFPLILKDLIPFCSMMFVCQQ